MTIKEIAELLGVSPTTVSNVIHGHCSKMSEDTRKKIEEALVKYHYIHTGRTRTSSSQEVRLVLTVFCLGEKQEVLTDPFCGKLLEAIQKELQKHDLHTVCEVLNREEEIIRLVNSRNIAGAIILGYESDKCESLTRRVLKPVVFIDCGEGSYDNIGLDDYGGTYKITSYLIRQCHRKIMFFADYVGLTSYVNTERLRGFRAALKDAGLESGLPDMIYLPSERNLRHELLRQFAKRQVGKPYTAGVFSSDLIANEAISIFYAQGVSVPEDFSVTGFDDNIYATLSRPMLTTVRQHPEVKGSMAVDMLVKRIYGQEIRTNYIELSTELIVRDSVRNIGVPAE